MYRGGAVDRTTELVWGTLASGLLLGTLGAGVLLHNLGLHPAVVICVAFAWFGIYIAALACLAQAQSEEQ